MKYLLVLLLLTGCSATVVENKVTLPPITYPIAVDEEHPETTLLIYTQNLIKDLDNTRKAIELNNESK